MGRSLLPTTPEEWGEVYKLANEEHSDGCTGVLDIEVECCYLHDHFYRTGKHWKDGSPVSRAEADAALRECYIKHRKPVIGLVRWLGVRLFGGLRGYNKP